LAIALLVAAVSGGIAGILAPWQNAVLIGWCVAALVFTVPIWVKILPADSDLTRRLATIEDNSRVAADIALVSASVISLIGVAFELVRASTLSGTQLLLNTALAVLSVILAWATVQTVFTLRYAHLWWSARGGVDFNEDTDPDYHDFAYLAFTIGMTYQVSDTDLTTKVIRRTALRHALLSYVFGTAIIAVTINVVAGLAP
jgi:uncharacterized membrane protein